MQVAYSVGNARPTGNNVIFREHIWRSKVAAFGEDEAVEEVGVDEAFEADFAVEGDDGDGRAEEGGEGGVGVDVDFFDAKTVEALVGLEEGKGGLAAGAGGAGIEGEGEVGEGRVRVFAEEAGEEGGHGVSGLPLVEGGMGRTLTRLSKKVAPPPMSVRAVEVVALTLERPGVSLFQ